MYTNIFRAIVSKIIERSKTCRKGLKNLNCVFVKESSRNSLVDVNLAANQKKNNKSV